MSTKKTSFLRNFVSSFSEVKHCKDTSFFGIDFLCDLSHNSLPDLFSNPVSYRCMQMISAGFASVPLRSYSPAGSTRLLELLKFPNPIMSGIEFMEHLALWQLAFGNVFIMRVNDYLGYPCELYLLHPDRIEPCYNKDKFSGYAYKKDNGNVIIYPASSGKTRSKILHLKNFSFNDEFYGVSSASIAKNSVEQHSQAGSWNAALLRNGARPGGVITVKNENQSLKEEDYRRLREQVEKLYSGSTNAGRPLLLEGGMEWKDGAITPRDMDFINVKDGSARDIALAFGVPPQLLGIPGDNSYSNFSEARAALWEQTILPLLDRYISGINYWLNGAFEEKETVSYDSRSISALASKREAVGKYIKDADYMTINEKREILGLPPMDDPRCNCLDFYNV